MLTRRRNSLLYEVRKLKRENAIFKYWSDFNGAITVNVEEGGAKQKLTCITNQKDHNIRTYTVREVKEELSKK